MKSKHILIIGLIVAAVTTVLFGKYIKDLDKVSKSGKNMVEIVTLKQDVKKNQKITKDILETKSLSANAVHAEAVKNMKDIEGSYALVDMKAGEILLASRFSNQTKEKEVLTRKIKEGYRAVSIQVNFEESVSTQIEPEDFVDIIFSEKDGQSKGVKTTKILENIRVLSVGKRIVEKKDLPQVKGQSAAEIKEEATNKLEYTSITVELTPDQVVALINADERGNIKFVLRSKVEPKK